MLQSAAPKDEQDEMEELKKRYVRQRGRDASAPAIHVMGAVQDVQGH
jgi:hypothetical protein